MSKEIAAAILTRVYYDSTAGAKQELRNHKEGFVENADKIGQVYARFLSRHDVYVQSANKPVK